MNAIKTVLTAAPGARVALEPDWFVLTDAAASAAVSLMGGAPPADRDRVKVFIDHETPCGSEAHAAKQKALIDFAIANGCELFNGRGIAYQLMLDKYVRPSQLVAHCGDFGSIYGSAGALAARLSAEDMALALVGGRATLDAPTPLRVRLTGSLRAPACAKDAALALLPALGDTSGRLPLIGGAGLEAMSASERTAFFQLLSAGGCQACLPDEGDAPAAVSLELGTVEPMVSLAGDISRASPAASMGETRISAVFIGGCSSGRIEDVRAAAAIARGRHVSRDVRALLAFATTEVYVQAANEGLISELMDAGVLVMNQGCSGCYAHSQGLVDGKDTVLSAGSRECPNCNGGGFATTLLCSAATAMESAIAGKIRPARI